MNQLLMKKPNESVNEYCHRICQLKNELDYTWAEIKEILDEQTGLNLTADGYRMKERNYKEPQISDDQLSFLQETAVVVENNLDEIRKERYKMADERTQINALYRRIAREDTLKEIAHDVASQMNQKLLLTIPSKTKIKADDREGILEISDWHYGIEINNHWNTYNPDIAKERIAKLLNEVIEKINLNNVTRLHVVNLGDLIAGRIHLQLRLNSRFDVITQIMEVTELLAEFLNELSAHAKIEYYDTLDNHSRLEPNLKESMDLESLARLTSWYLKERLKANSNIAIHENEYADDIITFETKWGYKVVGVHGHKDKPVKIVDNMTLMTGQKYDLALTAHLHHFSADEKNETLVVSNSSMMGTDDFAEKLRLSAKPAQNLIIVGKDNVAECIYRIIL